MRQGHRFWNYLSDIDNRGVLVALQLQKRKNVKWLALTDLNKTKIEIQSMTELSQYAVAKHI